MRWNHLGFIVNCKSNDWCPNKKTGEDVKYRHGETEGKSCEHGGKDWGDTFISQRPSRIVKTIRS